MQAFFLVYKLLQLRSEPGRECCVTRSFHWSAAKNNLPQGEDELVKSPFNVLYVTIQTGKANIKGWRRTATTTRQ